MSGSVMIRDVALSADSYARLKQFEALVAHWSPRINLISKATLDDIWQRHIIDSVQLYQHVPVSARRFADFGSGGGFPGVVMAILSLQYAPEAEHILVESDQRKSTFLREAIRTCGAKATVITERIEKIPSLKADLVSARALAALPQLFEWLAPHMAAGAVGLFPKGATYQSEVDAAQEKWQFDLDILPSQTDALARILKVGGLTKRG